MVQAELDKECSAGRICVRFGYSRRRVDLIRGIPGRSYLKAGRHWHVPRDLTTCRLLRLAFEDELEIGPNLKRWARMAIRREETMGRIALARTASLQRLPEVMPKLYEAIHLGPLGKDMDDEQRWKALAEPPSYQAADVEFLARSDAPLNGNEQGTGKTIEWIASVWEAGLEEGDHLIVCPKAAIDGTWEPELLHWQSERDDVEVFACVEDPKKRDEVLMRWIRSKARVRWVIVNPTMLMLRKDQTRMDTVTLPVKGPKKELTACRCDMRKGPHEHYSVRYPELERVTWRTMCIDEAHRGTVRNQSKLTAQSLNRLKVEKACLMSGTPMSKMGGSDLWGMLHFLNPKEFSSKWQFFFQYYDVHDNGYGKTVGRLREDREEEMYRALSPYILRRTKAEVAPWLPPKLIVPVPVAMSARQKTQYRQMLKEAYVTLGVNELTADNVLAKYTRLQQIANAHCKLDGDQVIPIHSPKVEAMIEKMDELGTFEDPSVKHLVFSKSDDMVHFIVNELRMRRLEVEPLTGDTKNRGELKERFQNGSLQVLVIVTTAGGVSLTLDAADTVHMIDEMWNPGDDEQAMDRAHRVSRIHQVTVYLYRSIGSIDNVIAATKDEKAFSHHRILDTRLEIMSALQAQADSGRA